MKKAFGLCLGMIAFVFALELVWSSNLPGPVATPTPSPTPTLFTSSPTPEPEESGPVTIIIESPTEDLWVAIPVDGAPEN